MNPNLLISYNPNRQTSAEKEIEEVFKAIKEKPKFLLSNHSGLFKLRVKDPKTIVRKLSKIHKKQPGKFRVTCHYTPIDKWCKSNIKEMQRQVKKYDKLIKSKEAWKMDLKKRRHRSKSTAIILKLTQMINKENVDLTNPEKVIRVELLGDNAGISLLNRDEFLNATKKNF